MSEVDTQPADTGPDINTSTETSILGLLPSVFEQEQPFSLEEALTAPLEELEAKRQTGRSVAVKKDETSAEAKADEIAEKAATEAIEDGEAKQVQATQQQRERAKEHLGRLLTKWRGDLQAANVNPNLANAFVSDMVGLNGYLGQLTSAEILPQLSARIGMDLMQQAVETFPDLATKPHPGSLKDYFRDIVEEARAGYVAQEEVNLRIKNALREMRAFYDEKGFTPASQEVNDGGGKGAKDVDRSSLDWALNAPIEEIVKANAKRR